MLMRTSSRIAGSRNQFLAQLARQDADLDCTIFEEIAVDPGVELISKGSPPGLVYFPETAVISIGQQVANGTNVEAAVIGYEGIVGISALSDSSYATYSAIVQLGGTAYRASRNDICRSRVGSSAFLAAMVPFADVLVVQMSDSIVSALRDTVERRLCRWLLMYHDRVLTDQLLVRHDQISACLGVRRASVTDCLHILEGHLLIRCHRGRIIIRNRLGLEQAAATSYGGTEEHYRNHIGPFGRRYEPQKLEVAGSRTALRRVL